VIEVVKYVRGNDCIVSDESALDEGTLIDADSIRQNLLDPVGYSFGYDLQSHIA
jgi:hypothetical protein